MKKGKKICLIATIFEWKKVMQVGSHQSLIWFSPSAKGGDQISDQPSGGGGGGTANKGRRGVAAAGLSHFLILLTVCPSLSLPVLKMVENSEFGFSWCLLPIIFLTWWGTIERVGRQCHEIVRPLILEHMIPQAALKQNVLHRCSFLLKLCTVKLLFDWNSETFDQILCFPIQSWGIWWWEFVIPLIPIRCY